MARVIITGQGAAKAELIENPESGRRIVRCACGGGVDASAYSRADALEQVEHHIDYVCPNRLVPGEPVGTIGWLA